MENEFYILPTKLGNLKIVNELNHSCLVIPNTKLKHQFNSMYWDKDGTLKEIHLMEENIIAMLKCSKDKHMTKSTVMNDLTDITKWAECISDNKDRGFITCRLKQIMNKLNEINFVI